MVGSISTTPVQKSRKYAIFAGCGLVTFAVITALMTVYWPFREAAVLKELEKESSAKVSVGAFHETYFPRPGCVLERVVFQHNPAPGTPPLLTFDSIRIEGSFAGLLARHVKRILAQGMRVFIPAPGTGEHFGAPERSSVVVDELKADGAILEVMSSEKDKPPLTFPFHEFALDHIGGNGPATFNAKLSNPEPPGEIVASGKFGPWNPAQVGQTAVAGAYTFQHADLSVFHGISGLLSSSGKFAGVLNHIAVEGSSDVPLFAVTTSSHQVQLQTQFSAVVNGENGDVFLQKVIATLGQTTLLTEGGVAGNSDQEGKTAAVQIQAREGRIQDLLLLFTKSRSAPMSGIVSFTASVSLPPGTRPFLKKVQLRGDFGIDAGKFAQSDTQAGVNNLSEGARGGKIPAEKDQGESETVLSDLKGHVLLQDGTARFSNLSFGVPGALARMQGTYDLITEKIDLRGTLITDSELSNTTHGFKAAILKVLDPLFKNKRGNYATPVRITGTYDHPKYGLDLQHEPRLQSKTQ